MSFVRQLGSQAGTQLNPLQDQSSQTGNLGTWDQVVALALSARRGRIDKPFVVRKSDFRLKLGKPGSIAAASANEAMVIAYECLRKGANSLVVQRLVDGSQSLSWIVFGSGATSTFTLSATAPAAGDDYTFAVQHMLCHSDGIRIKVHADAVGSTSSSPAKTITVKVIDADNIEIHSITGSLDPTATDDSGLSLYLPDVSERFLGDVLKWSIKTGAAISSTDDGYGKAAGALKWATSGLMMYFIESDPEYGGTVSDPYIKAYEALANTWDPYGYMITAGCTSVSFISNLIELSYQRNRQLIVDVPGTLNAAAAIAWVQQFDVGNGGHDWYPQFYWAPTKALDPLNGGMAVFGTSGNQAGQRCARNAVTNAYGFAAKNHPVAGHDYPLGRTLASLIFTPTTSWDDVRSDLAKSKINPVLPEAYADGTLIVFADCLTAANSTTSWRKLISVAEMASHIDEMVVRLDQETRFLPQAEKKRFVERQLEAIFSRATSSGWLTVGTDIEGQDIPPYEYSVTTQAQDAVDTVHITYWLHYDGCNRRSEITQVLR
jgi:hypothetical protein